jgi:hypothetical protein
VATESHFSAFSFAANSLRRPVLRKLLLATTLLAFSVPAFAQPRPYDPRDERRDDRIERSIPRAGEIARMGDTIARVADAIMDVRVGGIADAIDPGRGYGRRGRDQTLGDLASRRDPYARERVRDSVGSTTAGLGVAAEELAILTPVLRRSIEDATIRMEDAMRDSRLRRERGYDPRSYDPRAYDRDRGYDGEARERR